MLLLLLGAEVTDYWPEVEGDLTQVRWSHATNTREELQVALVGGWGIQGFLSSFGQL